MAESGQSQLAVAVIGVGHLGQHHARIYSRLPGVKLVAVVDTDLERARGIAASYGAEGLANAADLIGRVQAVSVAVPTEHHLAAAKPFLEAGAGVLVEKPLANFVVDAEKMVALAERRKATLQVGHVERFNPAYIALRERLRGEIRPRYIECHRLSPFRFRSVDIGVVFDLMIHDLDIVNDFVGAQIKNVEATGAAVITNHEDIANARITYANGCVANFIASRFSFASQRLMRVYADDYYVRLDYHTHAAHIFRRAEILEQARRSGNIMDLKGRELADLVRVEELPVATDDPLERELASFIECARNGTPPVVSGADALRAVRAAARVVAEIQKVRPHA